MSSVSRASNPLSDARLLSWPQPCDHRRGLLLIAALLLSSAALHAQVRQGDEAWSQGRYDEARRAYQRELAVNPQSVQANLRLGVLLSREGKLDSAVVLLARARTVAPADVDVRLAQAQVLAWKRQYAAALARYDSILTEHPDLREAVVGRARTLSWSERRDEAQTIYRSLLVEDPTDRDALFGNAQIQAWKGDFASAERGYRAVLQRNPQDIDARVGLGYVYLWEDRPAAARRQARYALELDSSHKGARELSDAITTATRPSSESSAHWSNDSDHNTNFWQSLTLTAPVSGAVGIFGTVNALEAGDRIRDATRIGGELGVSLGGGPLRLSGAAGARRLAPEFAAARTVATYRALVRYRPSPALGLGVGYARFPFDEIASLIERELNLELLEAAFDVRPSSQLTLYGDGGGLWLTDGNRRWSVSAGVRQKILRRFFVGAAARTLSYDRRGIGYFSPDRFRFLEGIAGYNLESGSWIGGLSGGAGAQQVGKAGATQSEWHLEGRLGQRWGRGNRVEVFGVVTNSAVSSTTGAFRYRSAGILLRLGL